MPQQTPLAPGELMVRAGMGRPGQALAGLVGACSSAAQAAGQPMSISRPGGGVATVAPAGPSTAATAIALGSNGLAGQGAVWMLALAILVILIGVATLSAWAGPDVTNNLTLQQTVTQALDEDTTSTRGRLVSATMRDATVEFVLRDRGDARANRAAAFADALAIARTLYEPSAARPVNVTVLGLAWPPSPVASYMPVLYASLPADRLVGRDWAQVRPDDLPTLAGVRWLPTGVCQAWHECGALPSGPLSS